MGIMIEALQIETPLPSRKAAQTLCDQIVSFLVEARPEVGTKLGTDDELAERAHCSQSTVKRAMERLRREGWIDRKPGLGSVVGPRLTMQSDPRPHHKTTADAVRLAVFAVNPQAVRTWYGYTILDGIDRVAGELSIVVEVIGRQGTIEFDEVLDRLTRSSPDVVAMLMPSQPIHAYVAAECMRLGVPCIGTGTTAEQLGIPAVVEDNRQGARLAVEHLIANGHERIGYVQVEHTKPWVFLRRRGWLDALNRAGIEPDERWCCWIDRSLSAQQVRRQVEGYLATSGVTALLCGSLVAERVFGPLVEDGLVAVPDRLSAVYYGHYVDRDQWREAGKPTVVCQPQHEMGRQLAMMARRLAQGREASPPEYLAYELIEGRTVRPLE